MANCKLCGELLVGGRSNRKFCDAQCQREFHRQEWHKANPKSPQRALHTSQVAERNVLLVSMDLLKRSQYHHLYRALFPGQETDLIMMNGQLPGLAYRVEVVSGSRTANGKLTHAKRDTDKFDVLAIVMSDDTIIYEPPYGEWPINWGLQ